MAVITSKDKCFTIDGARMSFNSRDVTPIGDGVRITNKSTGSSIDVKVANTTLNGVQATSVQDILTFVDQYFFELGGGDGQGVTWGDVTDKPAFLAEGATAAEARLAIGAGTSDYTLPAGGSATTYLAGDGTWKTPANTTYSVIPEAEFNTGSATTARAVSAQSLNRDIQAKVISYLSGLPGFAAGASLQVNATGDGFEWVTA